MSRVLAVDPGAVRVGLAVSDPLRISAQPLEVVDTSQALERIAEVCIDLEVHEIIVGLAVTESGEEGESARRARSLASEIAARTGLPVTTIDERYTTRMAEEMMGRAGVGSRARRGRVDKVAAAVLLRGYLDRPGKQP